MAMEKIVFAVHDPGGYDVVFPVVKRLQQEAVPLEFYCLGPAAKLNPLYGRTEQDVLQTVQAMRQENALCGVVTGTSWGSHFELQVSAFCKEAQIPVVAILDYWSNYHKRFQDGAGRFSYPDHYIVMDELAAQEAVQDGVPGGIIKVLGHPGLDKYVGCPRKKELSDTIRKKILFLSQPLSALYGGELGYTERQALADCIRAVHGQDNYSLYIKFHPKEDMNFGQQYGAMVVQGNLTDIMPEYDLIIGMNTMGLLHAVLMGIPAVSYQPNLRQPDMCITNKLGLTRLISTYQDLQMVLNTGMPGQAMKNEILLQKFIWLDGCSTGRVAGFIKEELLE